MTCWDCGVAGNCFTCCTEYILAFFLCSMNGTLCDEAIAKPSRWHSRHFREFSASCSPIALLYLLEESWGLGHGQVSGNQYVCSSPSILIPQRRMRCSVFQLSDQLNLEMASTEIRANSVCKSPLLAESIRAVLRMASSCYFPSRLSLGFAKASVTLLFKGSALRTDC